MDIKMGDYLPGSTVSTVCRCCLAEGCYKDISTEYFWMGKREVYSEMLKETLNLSIAFSKSGTPNCNSRLICEACISKLRDATDFKKQVQQCEKMFMQHLDPGRLVEIEVIPASSKESVKVECVKVENEASDDDFDQPALDDDDDYDDMDDQPLTSLAKTKPAMKKETDILDIMSNRQVTVKRKIPETETRPSKRKKDVKPSASKQPVAKVKKSKDNSYNDPARKNAEVIIKYTTAYPFRVNVNKDILCVYCGDAFEDPEDFRRHMNDEHVVFNLDMAFIKLPKTEFIKADLIDLKCRLCGQQFQDLESVADHLKDAHRKLIQQEQKIGVMPFFLRKNRWDCAVCLKNFPSLMHLNRHTITHFLSYVCDICGKSYLASTGLMYHLKLKHENEMTPRKIYCNRCHQCFPNMDSKMQHKRTEKKCMPHVCSECPERFPNYEFKQRHMIVVHGKEKKKYNCKDCAVLCPDRRSFYEHFKIKHSKECLECMHCGLKFPSPSRLNRHLGKHSV